MDTKVLDFESIVLKLASPEKKLALVIAGSDQIGTTSISEPSAERNSLFLRKKYSRAEKDFECYGRQIQKDKIQRIVCEKCGVEVTNSIVRRGKNGPHPLATPVSLLWFLKGGAF